MDEEITTGEPQEAPQNQTLSERLRATRERNPKYNQAPAAPPVDEMDTVTEESPEDRGAIAQLAVSSLKGVGLAFNEASNLAVGAARYGYRLTGNFRNFASDEAEAAWYDEYDARTEAFQDRFDFDIKKSEGLWGAYESIVQFGSGWVAGGVALKAAGVSARIAQIGSRGLRTITQGTIQGALTDTVFIDGQEERLSNMVQNGPQWLQNPVTDFLAADVDDSEAVGRMKNALEGALIGVPLEGLMVGLSVLKASRAVKAGTKTVDEAAEAVEVAVKKIDEVVEPERFTVEATDEGTYAIKDANGELEGVTYTDEAVANANASSMSLTDRVTRRRPVQEFMSDPSTRDAIIHAQKKILESAGEEGLDDAVLREISDMVNWSRIDSPDEVKALAVAIAQELEPAFKEAAFRSTDGYGQSFKSMMAQGRALAKGADPQEYLDNVLTQFNKVVENGPAILTASRLVLEGMTSNLHKMAQAMALDPTNTFVSAKVLEELDRTAMFALELTSAKSNVGRSLVSLRQAVDDSVEIGGEAALRPKKDLTTRPITKLMQKKGMSARDMQTLARTLYLTNGDTRAIVRMMKLVAREGTTAMTKRTGLGGVMDNLVRYYISMLLYGPSTQIVNAVSSAFVGQVMKPAEVIIGGAARAITTGDRAMLLQGLEQAAAPWRDGQYILKQAMKGMAQSWKEQRPLLDPYYLKNELGELRFASLGKNDEETGNIFRRFWSGFVNLPNRGMVSIDEFNKTMTYLSHARGQAMRRAREDIAKGTLKGDRTSIAARLREELEASVDEYGGANWGNSLDAARETTFTNKIDGAFGKWMQDGVNQMPMLRLVLPFVRTPVNIFNYTWARTPLIGLAQKQNLQMLKAGGEQAAEVLGRQATGLSLFMYAGFMLNENRLTGRGPSNPALRKQMMAAGWQPYSIKLGDKWVSYRRFEPIATPLALLADVSGIVAEAGDERAETGELIASSLAALTTGIMSKTYLQGLTQLFDAIDTDMGTAAGERYLGNLIANFVPGAAALRQLNPDPYMREAEGFVDYMRQGIPGLSDNIEPRRNFLGEPTMKSGRTTGTLAETLGEGIAPFSVIDSKDIDDVIWEMVRIGNAMPLPRETVGRGDARINLRDRDRWRNRDRKRADQSPYDRWMELVAEPADGGPSLRDQVADFMRSEQYQQMRPGGPDDLDGTRYGVVNDLRLKALERAKKRLFAEYPDLKRDWDVAQETTRNREFLNPFFVR